ncbi:hypothetical protein Nepgr_018689 [Nepenthes gracilis]|uniref:WRKY domain-containing protein n=1 Tax=Nepenthes gracilis TaxID=150966 RepID=A0AAD3SRT7_NEPGR|nr:hypothetical protein Nepgr_018689 [Nepenthes gracilis]
MEAGLGVAHGGHAGKEDQRGDSGRDDAEPRKEQMISMKPSITSTLQRLSVGKGSESLGSTKRDQVDELESTKAEMGEVMEENQRLKSCLDQIMKDYRALQMKFLEIAPNTSIDTSKNKNPEPREADDQEAELVSLSLGRSSSIDSKSHKNVNSSEKGKLRTAANEEVNKVGGGLLSLGLDCELEKADHKMMAVETAAPNSSTENSFDEGKDDGVGETWPPSKTLKSMRSVDDDVAPQALVKKARVSVRARCDTPTMNDGCQWRKYGQKISKGNPCPRAYYRCTVAPSCPVRKQVQRCADDMSILITTYEGTHNHPLPISATAMASTTSAAAYMLMSGSSSSGLGSSLPTTIPTPAGTTAATINAADLHGINFNLSDNSRSKPFFLPSTLISPSPSHSTITLDLTSSSSSSSTSQFHRATPQRYSSTNLIFNSSESNNSIPITWPNGGLSYSSQPYSNNNRVAGSSISINGRHPQDSFYQTYLQKSSGSSLSTVPNQQLLPADAVAAAAKVLTSDPRFQSVLTAALSSFISGSSNGSSGGGKGGGGRVGGAINGGNFTANWGDLQATAAAAAAASSLSKGNGCPPSSVSVAPSSNSQSVGSLMFLSSPLPFPTASKSSSSTSPCENKDHIN